MSIPQAVIEHIMCRPASDYTRDIQERKGFEMRKENLDFVDSFDPRKLSKGFQKLLRPEKLRALTPVW